MHTDDANNKRVMRRGDSRPWFAFFRLSDVWRVVSCSNDVHNRSTVCSPRTLCVNNGARSSTLHSLQSSVPELEAKTPYRTSSEFGPLAARPQAAHAHQSEDVPSAR